MKKQATYGDYIITINDDNSVAVSYQSEECSNAKKALREVSEKVGFDFDAGWTTRQFGSKLVDFLKTNAKYEATSMQQEAKKPITFTIFGKEIEIFEITENGMGDSYGGLAFYPNWEMAIDGQMLSDDDVDDIYCQSEEAQEDWKHSEQLSGEVIGLKRYENKASYSCQIEVDGEFDHSKLFVSWMEMTLCIEGKGSYTEDESLISGVVIYDGVKYNLDFERSEGSDCEVVWGIDSEEDDDYEEGEDADNDDNDDYLRISPDTVIDDIYIAFTLKYPHLHLRFLSESGVMDSIIDSSKTVAEIRKLYKTNYSTDSGRVSLAGKRTISDFCDELDAYGICRSWVCVHYGDELNPVPHGWDRTLSFAEEDSLSDKKYMIAGKRIINEKGEIITTEELDDSGASELSVSDQFAILAYHVVSLDDEIKEEEMEMIMMIAQNFEEYDAQTVLQRLVQERMGMHMYDVDDVMYAIDEEHHVTMFKSMAMVSLSDFNFTKEKQNMLNIFAQVWELREDKCSEFVDDFIQQMKEAYPNRKLVIE